MSGWERRHSGCGAFLNELTKMNELMLVRLFLSVPCAGCRHHSKSRLALCCTRKGNPEHITKYNQIAGKIKKYYETT